MRAQLLAVAAVACRAYAHVASPGDSVATARAAAAGSQACSSEKGWDYNGGDLPGNHSHGVAGPAGCCGLCDADPRCKFWTLELPGASGTPLCLLKSSRGERVAFPDHRISGSRSGGPPVPPPARRWDAKYLQGGP